MSEESPRVEEARGVLPHMGLGEVVCLGGRDCGPSPDFRSEKPHLSLFLQAAGQSHPQPSKGTLFPLMPGRWNKLFLSPASRLFPVWPSVPAIIPSTHLPPPGQCLLPLGQPEWNRWVHMERAPWPELTLRAGQRLGRRALEGRVGWLAGERGEGLAPWRMALGGRWQRRWRKSLQWADHGREEAGSQPGEKRQPLAGWALGDVGATGTPATSCSPPATVSSLTDLF